MSRSKSSSNNVLKVVLAGSLSAVVALLALIHVLNMELMDAFYIAFTLSSTVSAIVALSEKETNIGTVAGFTALLLFIGIIAPYLGLKSVLVFRTAYGQITIPIEFIPYIALAVVALFAVVVLLGGSVARTGLFTIGTLLSLAWFVVTDPYVKILVSTLIGVIAFIPLLQKEEVRVGGRMLLLTAVGYIPITERTQIVIDLKGISSYGVIVTPLLLFIALDPLNLLRGRGGRVIEQLASVAILLLVFLQMISTVFGL